MEMISSINNLIRSYLPENNYYSSIFEVIKLNIFNNTHNLIWQVVEFDMYPQERKKIIRGHVFETGLAKTIDYIKNKKIYKILVITSDDTSFNKKELKNKYSQFDAIFFTSNLGLDLGAHQRSLHFLNNNLKIKENFPIIVSNSSFIPLKKYQIDNLVKILNDERLLIGVSFAYGPRYYLLKPYHLQSFFLLSNFKVLNNIFSFLKLNSKSKFNIIRNGEVKISHLALKFKIPLLCYDGNNFFYTNKRKYSLFRYDHRIDRFE